MVERLPALPEMQTVIDSMLDAYGPTAIAAYNTDGTTCLILTEASETSSSLYLAIVQIDLDTLMVTAREIAAEPGDISVVTV